MLGIKKPEVLAPAGNFEKLKASVNFGADAVYLAGNCFGMRSAAGNFTEEELFDAVRYAHERGVKVYVTVNTMPHTNEYSFLTGYLEMLGKTGADAVIVSDLGVFMLAKEIIPHVPIHVSTQASVVSAQTCNAWYKMGASRVILARELSLDEIVEIRKNIPEELEIEAFVHGSMCISYSGRCLLSNYMTGRDANRGACTQPCRWEYKIYESQAVKDQISRLPSPNSIQYEIDEVKRPGQRLTMIEDGGDTFTFSSRDLCMIEHIPELVKSGLSCFKIEGRMKSTGYAATVTNAYRIAVDRYFADPDGYVFDPALMQEVESVCHREYATGFFFGDQIMNANVCTQPGYIREQAVLAVAIPRENGSSLPMFYQKNKFVVGDKLELLSPGMTGRSFTAEKIYDKDGNPIDGTPHPEMIFSIEIPYEVREGDILRFAKQGGADCVC
ncbi:MAG: U32 family peptidase [Clostridia bacterium]|nr:U32 family peptidase [Clostridia bacterium]